jgi:lipopolysaccharide export LptBFGC system permease protein LptF
MPWILWRHLTVELLKVLLLTASVIVVVVAFGAAIRPLADNSLGPGSVLKYVALAMVPMLQFALPFAAGFAATIVMHRFAADNELVAMAASGIRHGAVLAPVAGLGVLLLVLMLWLVNAVVPRFWGLMRDTVAADATAVLVAAVDRGEALEVGELSIYADAVEVRDAPPDSGALRRLVLSGVAAVQRTKGGSVEFIGDSAVVDVHRREDATVLKLSMRNGTGFRADEGTVAFIPSAAPDAIEVGRATERDARSTPSDELHRVRSELDAEPPVRRSMDRAAGLLERTDLLQCIERTLAAGPLHLQDEVARRRYRVEGARAQGDRLVPALAKGSVTLTELDGDRPIRRAECSLATLAASSGGEGSRVDLVVGRSTASDVSGPRPLPTRWPDRLRDLRLVECPSLQLASASSEDLLARLDALAGGPSASAAGGAASELRLRLRQVDTDMHSNIVQRLALAAAAPLVLLLGATLAAWKRESMPLAIYLLAFLPAILNVVLIAGGQQVMRSGAVSMGMLVMWSGNLVLAALLLHAFRQWARH